MLKRLLSQPSTWILIGFGVLYALISIPNHLLFRTFALDLGAYTNALWDYSHFQWNDSRVFKLEAENLLADHFDLYLMLLSPLQILFGTYTLLIVQILALLIGGVGVKRFLHKELNEEKLGVLGMVLYLSFFGVFSALGFDYHSNVLAACLVPWLFYHVSSANWGKAGLFLLLIWVGKENMSFWMGFTCLGLGIHYRKTAAIRNRMLIGSVVSLAFFLLVLKVIMPAFSNSADYHHFHYSVLGEGLMDALGHVLR
ncbi:MAG: DUF2079 domain-containing protein, partial [Bacteroidota bacterium]